MNTENKGVSSDILCILDSSGSMSSMGREPVQAWNMFIRDQKNIGENESYVSFYTFCHEVKPVYINKLLKDVKIYEEQDYVTEGSTSLYDAIRLAIKEQLKTERDKNVVFIIITDGLDNSSQGPTDKKFKTSKEEIAHLLQNLEKNNNWKIVYLAANQDAFQVGTSYGISGKACMGYSNGKELSQAMNQVSYQAASYRSQQKTYSKF